MSAEVKISQLPPLVGTVDVTMDVVAIVKNGVTYKATFEQLGLQNSGAFNAGAGTGLLTGGAITINANPAQYDVAAGSGYVVDNSNPTAPVITFVTWDAVSAVAPADLATDPSTSIGVNSAGTVIQQTGDFTLEQTRDIIVLGKVEHADNTEISAAINLPRVYYGSALDADDISQIIGPFNISGNVFSDNGANLNLNKSVGEFYKLGANYTTDALVPNTPDSPLLTAASFVYRTRTAVPSDPFTQAAPVTVVDPSQWDNGSGTLQSVTAGKFTRQEIYVYPGTNQIVLQYGQKEYDSLEEAELEVGNHVEDSNLDGAVWRASLIIQEGTTQLSTAIAGGTAKFVTRPDGLAGLNNLINTVATDLQKSYLASTNGQILTDDTRTAFKVRRGTTGGDTDSVLEILDGSGTVKARIDGDGHVTAEHRQRLINTASPSAILVSDGTLLFDTGSTAITISLPAASVGKVRIPFKDVGANSAVNNITFNRVGGDTIVDTATAQTSTVVASDGFSGAFESNGVDTWYLM